MPDCDCIIVGGGIMGLSIAHRLSRLHSFSSISVINSSGHPSASSQAAGILATHGARHYLSPLRRQMVESIRSYPEFLAELITDSGEDIHEAVGYRRLTHYHLYDPHSPEQENVRQKRLRRLQREESDDGIESPPPLPDLNTSDYFPSASVSALKFQSHILDPGKLLKKLRQSGEGHGVRYLSGQVTSINDGGREVTLDYLSPSGKIERLTGNKVILTPGSETGDLLSRFTGTQDRLSCHLKNLAGAILITDPFLPLTEETLITLYDKKYLLHKPDQALFGSHDWRTEDGEALALSLNELKELNELNRKEVVETLLAALIRLYPKLKNSPPRIRGLLFGKRLYNKDKLPLLGFLNPNTLICTALYKSGLALAPLYSRLVVKMLDRNYSGITEATLKQETDFLSPYRKNGIVATDQRPEAMK